MTDTARTGTNTTRHDDDVAFERAYADANVRHAAALAEGQAAAAALRDVLVDRVCRGVARTRPEVAWMVLRAVPTYCADEDGRRMDGCTCDTHLLTVVAVRETDGTETAPLPPLDPAHYLLERLGGIVGLAPGDDAFLDVAARELATRARH